MPIPVIDLFAGPGGLGEGFSSLYDGSDQPLYKIRLSIEMDAVAHQTLLLRSFFRQFPRGQAPVDYYKYLRAPKTGRDQLFAAHGHERKRAEKEAWKAELGKEPNSNVDQRIQDSLGRSRRNWVLMGGPPCQAYSLAGRVRMENSDGLKPDKRHFLYREYLRIIAAHKPAVFVMENVRGIISSKVAGKKIFPEILRDLQKPSRTARTNSRDEPTYRLVTLYEEQGTLEQAILGNCPEADSFLVKAEQHGIPQKRHRVFVIGIRHDVHGSPRKLKISQPKNVADLLIDKLPELRSGLSREEDGGGLWLDAVKAAVREPWFWKIDANLRRTISKIVLNMDENLDRGGDFISCKINPPKFGNGWFHDSKIGGVINHSTRSHIRKDLHRYLFASVFALLKERSPVMNDFPSELLPKHKNCSTGYFADRFKVQTADNPSTTITSHISRDGHYYIHPDPTQCRSLTVREAARLQTFPDNYFFEGFQTQQYHQVGNAVPPYLAKQIAECLLPLF